MVSYRQPHLHLLLAVAGTPPPPQRSSFVNCESKVLPFQCDVFSDVHRPLAFFLTAHFSEEDYPYEWLMLWLSRRPEWQRSREFETTTNSSSPGFYGYRETDGSFIEEDGAEDQEVSGKTRMRVVFQPTTDTTHTIFYHGHWLRVRRGRKSNGYEMLSIRYAAPNTWQFSCHSWADCNSRFCRRQCRCAEQLNSQAARPAGEKGVRGRGRPPHPNLFCRFLWLVALH